MTTKQRIRGTAWLLAATIVLFPWGRDNAITKLGDRQFPLQFCPGWGWQDMSGNPEYFSFVASFPADSTSVRLTFSTPNNYDAGYVHTHIDNVSVVLSSEFPGNSVNVHAPLPGGNYEDCYFPPGGDPADSTHVPSFVFTNFIAPGPELPLLNLFNADVEGWTGDVYFDASLGAPTDPGMETVAIVGSLGIGTPQQQGTVSASRIVTGLSVGQEYVVFAWWHAEQVGTPFTVEVDSADCMDVDGDGFVDCSGSPSCVLLTGQTCGDCDDTDATIHAGVTDATCDGIDQNCSGTPDEGFAGGCQCAQRGAGLVGWWPGEGNADDLVGANDGTITGPGVTFTGVGMVGEAFYFAYTQAGGVELPDAPELEFTSQTTLEAWVRPDELTESSRPIISKLVGPYDYAYGLQAEVGGYLEATLSADGTATDSLTSPPGVLSAGVWAHVATTFDTGVWKLYVNGEVVASKTSAVTSIYDLGSTHPNIGRSPSGTPEFVGYIDEPAMYDRALSEAEIRAIYEAGAQGMCNCNDPDGDGYGTGPLCPGGVALDCNEGDASIHPGAPELCNGVDDNCDGQFDDGLTQSTFYLDGDNDGYGNAAITIQSCAAPALYVADGTDCNDAEPAIHPGVADDTCNGIDEDCDAQFDDGFAGGCQCTLAPEGLTNWWPGDGNTLDVRGGSGTILLNGTGYAAGMVGQAFSFDGIDDYVEAGNYPHFAYQNTGIFSIAAWIRLSDPNALVQQAITATTATSIEKGHFFIWENSGGQRRLRLALMNGTAGVPVIDSVSPPDGITDNGWHHVAVVGDGLGVTFYVDGTALPGTGTFGTFSTGGSAYPLNFGRCPYGTPLCQFSGQIDEVQLYDRALGSLEVHALYDAGSAPLCRCVDGDYDGYQPGFQGYTCSAGVDQDCDDGDVSIHPGAPELCNGVDDDCNGTFDDGQPQSTFYRDLDGDGFGEAATTTDACAAPAGYVADSADCDDADASINPGAADAICDGIDQNCSGAADEDFASPPNGWIATPLAGAPSARRYMTMVSTGDSVIVWGGIPLTNTGGVYRPRDPATDAWTPTSVGPNVPSARFRHTAVWTGTEMIVWGGTGGLTSGGRYDPSTDTWTPTSLTGAPVARALHTAVWTGSKMIVWGGTNSANTGGVYDPVADTWTATATTGSPMARTDHTAVWTGTEMIVWGGVNAAALATGGRYDPSSNAWSTLPATPTSARYYHTAVWTGTKMIVWGGWDGSNYLGDGAAYDPVLNSWTAIAAGGPSPRALHTAVWDPAGGLMVIWGGAESGGTLPIDGWAYSPSADTWTPLPTVGSPIGRVDFRGAWLSSTGEMVVWGGGPTLTDTGGRIVVAPFECGMGACTAESSYTCTAGVLGYGACTPGTPTAEVCNGIDDDCDGTSDNGVSGPSGNPSLVEFESEFVTGTQVVWSAVPDATGYDVVYGSLLGLRGTGGDFAVATTGCLGDDVTDLFVVDLATPAPGEATWHLVRAVDACGNGSYGGVLRDTGVAASPVPCP